VLSLTRGRGTSNPNGWDRMQKGRSGRESHFRNTVAMFVSSLILWAVWSLIFTYVRFGAF
jgi:hypothetical protein